MHTDSNHLQMATLQLALEVRHGIGLPTGAILLAVGVAQVGRPVRHVDLNGIIVKHHALPLLGLFGWVVTVGHRWPGVSVDLGGG